MRPKINLGWFSWSPGLYDNKPNSAGNASWTRFLFDELRKLDITPHWLPNEKPPRGIRRIAAEKCDVIIICWRWEVPGHPERSGLYFEQLRLIEKAQKEGIPVIVHDEDHMMLMTDRKMLDGMGAIVTAPEINPREGVRTLHFPNPYGFPYTLDNKFPFFSQVDLMYVGNVYGRYDMAKKFLGPFSKRFSTTVYGNWLEDGADRPGAGKVREDFPYITFKGRLEQRNVLENLAQATATLHMFKPSYGPPGFVTLRWAEAAASSTFSFVPDTFTLPEEFAADNEHVTNLMTVKDGAQLADNYEDMHENNWKKGVLMQQQWVRENMTVSAWIEIIKEVAP